MTTKKLGKLECVKWLHLSDLHFILDCAAGEECFIKDTFIEFLRKEKIKVDDLFITGDFRSAEKQAIGADDALAQIIATYIKEIANEVGIIDEKRIHIVPGNHDLNRNTPLRKTVVHGIYSQYANHLKNGNVDKAIIPESERDSLNSAFGFFKTLLGKLYSNSRAISIWKSIQEDIHYYNESNPYFNILCANTAIMSVEESDLEKERLILGHINIHRLLKKLIEKNKTNTKPVIVLAHHPLEHLDNFECDQLKNKYFYECGVYVYLSGHEHKSWSRTENENFIFSNQGSFREGSSTEVSFGIGEYNALSEKIICKSYRYQKGVWGNDAAYGATGGNRLAIKKRKINPYSADIRIPMSQIDYGLEKTISEAEQEFNSILKKQDRKDAIRYLLAGLSTAQDWKLTSQLFHRDFYVSSPDESSVVKKLTQLFADDTYNLMCLKGEAGSGKSTFIKTMAVRSVENQASFYRYHILDCAEITENNPKTFPCVSIEKQIANELRRMHKASQNNGALWETYFIHVLKNIERLYDVATENNKNFVSYIKYVREQVEKHKSERYSFLASQIAGDSCNTEHSPWMQLALFLIILVCKNCLFIKNSEPRKHIIAFDNIETYTNCIELPIPTLFYVATKLIRNLFDFLILQKAFKMSSIDFIIEPKFMRDFTFVICARYTTQLRTQQDGQRIYGRNDKYIIERKFYDFTVEAVLRKLRYLKTIGLGKSEFFDEVKKVISILVTKGCIERHLENNKINFFHDNEEESEIRKYSKDNYLPLFHNDFRKAMRALAMMYEKSDNQGINWMDRALTFRQYDYSKIGKIGINATRMILIKNVIDDYVKEGFLNTIGFDCNIDNQQKTHSVARILISFLQWKQKNIRIKNYRGIPVTEVIEYFSNVYERNTIVEALIKLSMHVDDGDTDKEKLLSGWGYFVDVLKHKNYDIRQSLLDTKNDKKTMVRLTPAGLCMAGYITLQFEFLNARIPANDDIPLIMHVNSIQGDESIFKQKIERVYDSAKALIEGLIAGIRTCGGLCEGNCNCQNYLRLREFFEVVMEHILYIDRVRMLKWATDPMAEDIVLVLLEYIKKYFELLNKVDAIDCLSDAYKSKFKSFQFSNESRIFERSISIDKEKLDSFLLLQGGLWDLKEESLYVHFRDMT